MRTSPHPVLSVGTLTAGLLCLAPPALAAGNEAPSADSVQQLDAVVVTSGKRREKQRDVAGTVSVVQGAELEKRGALDQEDVFKLTPGVQFNKQDPGRAVPSIRGIGTAPNSQLLGQQQASTGIYVEDMPFTDPFIFMSSADIAPFDLERVEVLRGPQGALYGSSSLGGAVRYVFNKPDLKASEFSLLGSVSSVAGGGLGGSLFAMGNIPLSDGSAGLRVVAFDRRDSGYIRNLGTGQDEANALHQRGTRVLGRIKPSASLSVTGTLLSQVSDIDDGFGVSAPDRLVFSSPTASPRRSQLDFANLQVDMDFGVTTLSAITGAYRKSNRGSDDQTRYLGPLLAATGLKGPFVHPFVQRSDSFSQELRLASNGGTPLSYVVGLFYQRTRFDQVDQTMAPGAAATPGYEALVPGDALSRLHVNAHATESALFADTEYSFAGGWSAGLGGRAYRTRLDYAMDFAYAPLLGSSAIQVQPNSAASGFTPKLTVKYRFGEQQWYALASKGYRFGGVNFNPPALSRYRSDALWNYETGLRLSPAKNLRLDISVFHLDWKDAQVTALLPANPAPIIGTANVGKARSNGIEFSAQWRATPDLNLGAALAYTDAKTTAPYTAGSGAVVSAGSRLPGTARLQTTLQASYDFAGPFETAARFSATHAYLSGRVFDIEGRGTAPGYGHIDLRLSFDRDHWGGAFFINNATDKRGISGATAGANLAFIDYYLIRPRMVGVSLRYDY